MLDQSVTRLGQTISMAIRIEQAYPRIRQARLLVADDLPGAPCLTCRPPRRRGRELRGVRGGGGLLAESPRPESVSRESSAPRSRAGGRHPRTRRTRCRARRGTTRRTRLASWAVFGSAAAVPSIPRATAESPERRDADAPPGAGGRAGRLRVPPAPPRSASSVIRRVAPRRRAGRPGRHGAARPHQPRRAAGSDGSGSTPPHSPAHPLLPLCDRSRCSLWTT